MPGFPPNRTAASFPPTTIMTSKTGNRAICNLNKWNIFTSPRTLLSYTGDGVAGSLVACNFAAYSFPHHLHCRLVAVPSAHRNCTYSSATRTVEILHSNRTGPGARECHLPGVEASRNGPRCKMADQTPGRPAGDGCLRFPGRVSPSFRLR